MLADWNNHASKKNVFRFMARNMLENIFKKMQAAFITMFASFFCMPTCFFKFIKLIELSKMK